MRKSPRATRPTSSAATPYCAASERTRARFTGRNRYDGARASLTKERRLIRFLARERDLRGKAVARKTRFRQRYGQAAIAHVVRGLQRAFACERYQQRDQPLFRGEIHGGRRARDDSANRARIFGGGKFAGVVFNDAHRVIRAAPSSRTITSPSARNPMPSAREASSIMPSTPSTGVGSMERPSVSL